MYPFSKRKPPSRYALSLFFFLLNLVQLTENIHWTTSHDQKLKKYRHMVQTVNIAIWERHYLLLGSHE